MRARVKIGAAPMVHEARMAHTHTAIVRFANGARAVECRVQHSSASGAQLKVPEGTVVPDRFELHDEGATRPRTATVVWRRTGVVGIRFNDYFSA